MTYRAIGHQTSNRLDDGICALGFDPPPQTSPNVLMSRISTDLEPKPNPERAAIGVDHHLRHAVGVLGHDGGRPDDGARHHHDLHLLRLLRHVQRPQLPLAGKNEHYIFNEITLGGKGIVSLVNVQVLTQATHFLCSGAPHRDRGGPNLQQILRRRRGPLRPRAARRHLPASAAVHLSGT